jgi:hypothetical protein
MRARLGLLGLGPRQPVFTRLLSCTDTIALTCVECVAAVNLHFDYHANVLRVYTMLTLVFFATYCLSLVSQPSRLHRVPVARSARILHAL